MSDGNSVAAFFTKFQIPAHLETGLLLSAALCPVPYSVPPSCPKHLILQNSSLSFHLIQSRSLAYGGDRPRHDAA
jgi:hypothetical protein